MPWALEARRGLSPSSGVRLVVTTLGDELAASTKQGDVV